MSGGVQQVIAAATDGAGEQLIYEALADAFAAEGVDHHFLLMGHGQMLWAIAMDKLPGMRSIDARHEHCAVAEAIGYHFATGKVGVASVTCGPGFTQTMTALTSAAQARVPLVILAADSPLNQRWYNQSVDQAALARATGSHFIAAHSPALMRDHVQEAFYTARFERRPVVLSIPYDLLKLRISTQKPYIPSTALLPQVGPMPPNPADIERLAERLRTAQRPIFLAGRGAVRSGAGPAIEALANATGALLATSLPARGLFDHSPFSVGVAGGFASQLAVQCFAEADMVVAIGASLTHYTVDGGALFPNTFTAQIDENPLGMRHGRRAADIYVRGDATLAAQALMLELEGGTAARFRSDELARRIAETPPDTTPYEVEPGLLDPREVVKEIDRVIPKDWDIVSGTGHSSYFYTHLRNRRPEQFHVLREFGAIGSSLAMAIGVAAARDNGKVVLLDGDGGLMMHIQELESIQRQGIRLIICALNDGGFGAEIHKLRKIGMDEKMATFGRPDFAAIGKGFGLDVATIDRPGQIEQAFAQYDPEGCPAIWDVHISTRVSSPRGRKQPN